MDHEQAIQSLAAESYLLGELTPEERVAFEEHFFECAACAEDVRQAARFMDDAHDVLAAGPAAPAPSKPPASGKSFWNWFGWLQPQQALRVAAVLAVACFLESLTIPDLLQRLREAYAPRIAESAVLKPQTRGEATVITAAAGQPVMLMFDVPETRAGQLRYIVTAADGSPAFSLTSSTPSAGQQAILSVPRLNLAPGAYVVIVKTVTAAGEDGPELSRYPWVLKNPEGPSKAQ